MNKSKNKKASVSPTVPEIQPDLQEEDERVVSVQDTAVDEKVQLTDNNYFYRSGGLL